MKILINIVKVILGIVFIASGVLKLNPIEPFEYLFIDLGVTSWQFAPFFARGIIFLEIAIGLFLIVGIWIRTSLFLSLFILLFFSLYLAFTLIVNGNSGNCMCFGDNIYMSPIESLFKNGILIILNLFLLYVPRKLHYTIKYKWVSVIAILLALTPPFVLNPVRLYSENEELGKPYIIDYLNEIPSPIFNTGDTSSVDLSRGEKIIAFLSVTCPHCRHAAYKLTIANKKGDLPPIYFVFKGAKSNENKIENNQLLVDFFKRSNSFFPYSFFNDNRIFAITEGIFPTILYIKGDTVFKKWRGSTLSFEELEQLDKQIKSNPN